MSLLSQEDFVWEDFVLGGFCAGGFCVGGFCTGRIFDREDFVREDFVPGRILCQEANVLHPFYLVMLSKDNQMASPHAYAYLHISSPQRTFAAFLLAYRR